MLMSLEPLMLIATVPGEVAFAVGSAGATAIVAQWRASRKDQADSIAAITKSNTNQERLISLVENVVKENTEIKSDIRDGIRQLGELRQELTKPPTGSGARRASNG